VFRQYSPFRAPSVVFSGSLTGSLRRMPGDSAGSEPTHLMSGLPKCVSFDI
jgi:hypothetical protein